MSAVLITGSAGAGKSAVAAVLERRGMTCIGGNGTRTGSTNPLEQVADAILSHPPDNPAVGKIAQSGA
jgi:dephospho-CoA kinase